MSGNEYLKSLSIAAEKTEQDMMSMACNNRIPEVAPGALIEREEHTLQNTGEVPTHQRNVEVIHSYLSNRLPIHTYHCRCNEARNRVAQALQSPYKSGVIAFPCVLGVNTCARFSLFQGGGTGHISLYSEIF